MATFNQRDHQELHIGTAATATTGDISSLNVGEIGIFTPAGTRVTEASAANTDRFVIATKRSANASEPILLSSVITKSHLVANRCARRTYIAPTTQVTYVGYNGNSGTSIDVINNNFYHVRVHLSQSITSNHGGLYLKHGIYQSDASATQAEVAAGISLSLANDISKETDPHFTVERLCDNAGVVVSAGTGAITATQGSKYIVAATDIDDQLVVGAYIRFGTTTADPVYKIVSIDATNNTAELDQRFTGTSGSTAAASLRFITEVLGDAANWGVKLTGRPRPFRTGKLHYAVAKWRTGLENMGTTSFSETLGQEGVGSENQMRELEWFIQGNEGDFMRMGEPNIYDSRTDVVTGTNYDTIDLYSEEIYTGSVVSGPVRKMFTIAVPTTTPDYADGGTANDITDVLEVLVYGTANGNFAL